ncbi:histidine kinase [Rhizobium sp. R72]|uniref:HWE histidine kinase domain-containing protein n=1 Tax=unclassified Rhizobium TaxID=2613769 RepID=UPI000B5353BD|nr:MULTISPECIES: HWE histidine kinase domain-containing protein [unclassified Rhizobium]OWW05067.1 histidine kinase [Rhizobium sp. R72]OWW06124.1 histidine kinase [Rhizobium sp. R711]
MLLEDLYRLLRAGHVQAQGIVDTMTQPVIVLDQGMCVSTANHAFLKTFRVERDDIIGESFFTLGNGQWDIDELRRLIELVIPKAAAVIGFEVRHNFPMIGKRTILVDARRLAHPDDNSMSILVIFEDVTEQRRHEAEHDFILSEMRHRMKNLFSVVRVLARATPAEGRTGVDYRDSFLARLEVTLRAQEIAATVDTADLDELIRQSVGEHAAERLHCEGPSVEINPSKVVSMSMIFHELATNAAKYGALTVPDGSLSVEWSVESGPRNRPYVKCVWREENGPPVTPPRHKGYGTELIEGTTAHIGGNVELNYAAQGLTAIFRFPI